MKIAFPNYAAIRDFLESLRKLDDRVYDIFLYSRNLRSDHSPSLQSTSVGLVWDSMILCGVS